MKIPRPAAHHFIIAALLAVLVTGSALLAGDSAGGTDLRLEPSVENRGQGGLRALFLTCRGLGLPVDTWYKSTELLDESVPALVAVETSSSLPAAGDLLRWTREGGRLILSSRDGFRSPWTGFGLSDMGRGRERPVTFVGDAADWCDAGPLSSRARGFARPLPVGARVLATVGEGPDASPWLVQFPLGGGRVFALADAHVLTNDGITLPDAAVTGVRLIEHVGAGDEVTFCETLHRGARGGDPLSAYTHLLASTGPGRAILGAAFFTLLFLLSGATRFGRVRRRRILPRRSEHEYIEALGGLLHHEHAWIDIGAFLREGLRRRVRPGARPQGPPDDEDIVNSLTWDGKGRREAIAADVEILSVGREPSAMLAAMRRLDSLVAEDRATYGEDTHESR